MTNPIQNNPPQPTSQNQDSSAFSTAVHHAGGFVSGAVGAVADSAVATYDLAKGAAEIYSDLNLLGRMGPLPMPATKNSPNYARGLKNLEKAGQVVKTIANDPMVIVDGVVDPIVQDWQQGEYGHAVGRGVAEVAMVVGGPKGARNYAKTGYLRGKPPARIMEDYHDGWHMADEILNPIDIVKLRNIENKALASGQKVFIDSSVGKYERRSLISANKKINKSQLARQYMADLKTTNTKIAYVNMELSSPRSSWYNSEKNIVVINFKYSVIDDTVISGLIRGAQHAFDHKLGHNQQTQFARYQSQVASRAVENSTKQKPHQPYRRLSNTVKQKIWNDIKKNYPELPQGQNPFEAKKLR